MQENCSLYCTVIVNVLRKPVVFSGAQETSIILEALNRVNYDSEGKKTEMAIWKGNIMCYEFRRT